MPLSLNSCSWLNSQRLSLIYVIIYEKKDEMWPSSQGNWREEKILSISRLWQKPLLGSVIINLPNEILLCSILATAARLTDVFDSLKGDPTQLKYW